MQKSLKKALDILEYLAGPEDAYGISDICHKLNLNKSNVHDILTTFEECGYVKKDMRTHKYSLSHHILRLAHKVSNELNYTKIVHQEIMSISHDLNELVYFAIPDNDGHSVMYLDSHVRSNTYSIRQVTGMTAPLVCTGIGKAILAHMSEDEIDKVLERPLIAYTQNTIVDKHDMLCELAAIRERGYSIDNMEHEFGIKCVAVPVFNQFHNILGAISVTGPSLRFPSNVLENYAKRLMQSARRIEDAML